METGVTGVLDCGLGNVASVVNMVTRAGGQAKLISEASSLSEASRLVLPGVGSFDAGVRALREAGLWDAVLQFADSARPLLGICLGMQLLSHGSEEGSQNGLGLVDAHFSRFGGQAKKSAHVGWNIIQPSSDSVLFEREDQAEQRFYFVHSYRAVPASGAQVLATARHGAEFPAAYRQANVFGVQFHPEKSHRYGLAVFQAFLKLDA